MKYTYEDCIKLLQEVKLSNLEKDSRLRLNVLIYDLIDKLEYNPETRLLDYVIDQEDELDEHEYNY